MYKVEDFFRSIKLFFVNTWRFRKELSCYYPYEFETIFPFLHKHLTMLKDNFQISYVERTEQVKEIERALVLLTNQMEDSYAERLGYVHGGIEFIKENPNDRTSRMFCTLPEDIQNRNSEIIVEAAKLREKERIELWNLMKKKSESWWD